MRGQLVKSLAAAALRAAHALPGLGRRLAGRGIAVFMYHGVVRAPLPVADWCFLERSAFRSQIAYLKKRFRLLSLSEALACLKDGGPDEPSAVVTFDDGYQDTYEVAFPILREYEAPATVFLTTDLLDSGDTVWFCRLLRALSRARRPELKWNGARFDLRGPRRKAEASERLQRRLKRLPAPALEAALRKICSLLETDPFERIEEGSPYRMLSSESVRRMLASGLIELGAHTQTHAILSLLPPRRQRRENEGSLRAVGALTGRPCRLFAYPNGGAGDYGAAALGILAASGVEAAVTSVPGHNDRATPLLELRRYCVGADLSLPAFELMAHRLL